MKSRIPIALAALSLIGGGVFRSEAGVAAYQAAVQATPDLVSYYKFDDGTANDNFGTNNGTLLGTAGFATGFGGGPDQALNLDGSGYDSLGGGAALISIPALTFASTTNGTVEMWAQAGWTDLTPSVFYAMVSSTAYSMNYNILMTGDKSALVFWSDTAWQTFSILAPGTNWHHLAVAIAPAGTNCTCTVIWDGVSLGTQVAPWASGPNNTVQLGTPQWNGSTYGAAGNWIGKLDEVAFYSTHLPVSSIQAHYAATTGPMIHIAPSGANVAISWSAFGNWVLESAPQLPAVRWTAVQTNGSPATISISGGNNFFRLRAQ